MSIGILLLILNQTSGKYSSSFELVFVLPSSKVLFDTVIILVCFMCFIGKAVVVVVQYIVEEDVHRTCHFGSFDL